MEKALIATYKNFNKTYYAARTHANNNGRPLCGNKDGSFPLECGNLSTWLEVKRPVNCPVCLFRLNTYKEDALGG